MIRSITIALDNKGVVNRLNTTLSGGAWRPRSAGPTITDGHKILPQGSQHCKDQFLYLRRSPNRAGRGPKLGRKSAAPSDSKASIRRLRWSFEARVVQICSPALGLQKPPSLPGQFGRKVKTPKPRVSKPPPSFRVYFLHPHVTIATTTGWRW